MGLSALMAIGATAASAVTTVTFSWSSTPTVQTQDFSSAVGFDLVLSSYTGVGSVQTGYVLRNAAGDLFTSDSSACNGAGSAFFGDGCNLVQAAVEDGTVLLTGLAAGDYTLGIYDSARPVSGTLAFDIAPVPLPAGGLLLLGGLGAAGVIARRRRKA
ncbi:MAG: VPLPA-CTERM sorting domain-containing protein [Pseudomonadota bacterium]